MRSELPLSTLAGARVTSEDEQATPQVCVPQSCPCLCPHNSLPSMNSRTQQHVMPGTDVQTALESTHGECCCVLGKDILRIVHT